MTTECKKILRELGKEYAEIAHLPVQQEKVNLWKALNDLQPIRPMVMIHQWPLHELLELDNGFLKCRLDAPLFRSVEYHMRLTLLRFRNFPGDMVVLPEIRSPLAVSAKGGYEDLVKESTLATDRLNDVVSHKYEDVIKTEADLEKITDPVISHDEKKSARWMEQLQEIFDGILDVKPGKIQVGFDVWDTIATLKSVEKVLDDIIDRPDFVHKLVDKLFKVYRSTAEQYESLGLLDGNPDEVHCTGAYTNELPQRGYSGPTRIVDSWACTASQMFSCVSPAMDKEFQIDYVEKYMSDFGLLYYGCCEPLHDRIDLIRQLKNVRKISISPWADIEKSAQQLGSSYVMSRKPNPALLALNSFDENLVRSELSETLNICKKYNTPCELILKDISTVKYQPERLIKWNEIAMELVTG